MGIDIADKLMPNLLTMAVQLLATFVIYLMYKKYLHEPVQAFMKKRADYMHEELQSAEIERKNAMLLKEESKLEHHKAMEELSRLKEQMMRDAESEKQEIIKEAQLEINRERAQMQRDLAEEKAALYQEAQRYILEIAIDVNKKVLSKSDINQQTMFEALAKELDAHDYKH